MITSGLAAMTAARAARALRPSATTGSAPARRMAAAFSGERVMPVTRWPADSNAGMSARPTAPVAPATKMRMRSSCHWDGVRHIAGSHVNAARRERLRCRRRPPTGPALFASAERADLIDGVLDFHVEVELSELGGRKRGRALHACCIIGGADLVLADPVLCAKEHDRGCVRNTGMQF